MSFADRLNALETRLEEHSVALNAFANRDQNDDPAVGYVPSNGTLAGPSSLLVVTPTETYISTPSQGFAGTDARYAGSEPSQGQPFMPRTTLLQDDELSAMIMPIAHSTKTADLLLVEKTKSLIGGFPPDVFLDAEASRYVPKELSLSNEPIQLEELPQLEFDGVYPLVEIYFSTFHVETPVLDHADFLASFRRILSMGLDMSSDSALCLIVLALGSVAAENLLTGSSNLSTWVPGAKYIGPALQIITKEYLTTFGTELTLPLALFLASKYFGYLLRPLQSWRLAHMASTNIQQLFSRYVRPASLH